MKYKILVVEDDPILRDNISQILENEGFTVETAENGKVGIEKVQTTNPDLILSDIMMPEMDGFEFLEEIIKNIKTATIPVIFLTAKTELENLRKGMTLGADDYIFKPFNIDELINAIQIRLKKKEASNKKFEEAKHQILSKLHHDLRTPMMPIIGYSDAIDGMDDLNQVKNLVKVIKKSGEKLQDRIEKFLIYNQLVLNEENFQSNKDSKTPIDKNYIQQFLSSLERFSVVNNRVICEVESAELPIKEKNLKLMLKELIENALNFSPQEKEIYLKGYTSNSDYVIEIIDYGKGFREEEIRNISSFKKFGDNQIGNPGLGLGLAIVKRISELNNIKFDIKNTEEKQTICRLIFSITTQGKQNAA